MDEIQKLKARVRELEKQIEASAESHARALFARDVRAEIERTGVDPRAAASAARALQSDLAAPERAVMFLDPEGAITTTSFLYGKRVASPAEAAAVFLGEHDFYRRGTSAEPAKGEGKGDAGDWKSRSAEELMDMGLGNTPASPPR